MFFAGSSIGDAVLAPYDDHDFATIFKQVFLGAERDILGVIPNYSSWLGVTNTAGNTIRLWPGAAIVNGRPYINNANIDRNIVTPGADTNWYRMVLRDDEAAQTVRSAILGPNNAPAANYPAITQNDGAGVWDIILYDISITSGGVITLVDRRNYITSSGFYMPVLSHYQTPDLVNHEVDEFVFAFAGQIGMVVPYVFPVPFDEIYSILMNTDNPHDVSLTQMSCDTGGSVIVFGKKTSA